MQRSNTITLPWPPASLKPNSRKKHLHSTSDRKKYKAACWALAKAAKIDPSLTHLDITFHPPDNRRRDLDNLLGSVKYGLDGVATAMGVDDYGWSMSIRRAEEDPKKLGAVVITFTSEEATIPLIGTIS